MKVTVKNIDETSQLWYVEKVASKFILDGHSAEGRNRLSECVLYTAGGCTYAVWGDGDHIRVYGETKSEQ